MKDAPGTPRRTGQKEAERDRSARLHPQRRLANRQCGGKKVNSNCFITRLINRFVISGPTFINDPPSSAKCQRIKPKLYRDSQESIGGSASNRLGRAFIERHL